MMTPAVLRSMEARKVWNLRDDIIDARYDDRISRGEAADQIRLLANLAEAVEDNTQEEYMEAARNLFLFSLVARVPASDWLRVSVS